MIRPSPKSTLFPYTTLFRSFTLRLSKGSLSPAWLASSHPYEAQRQYDWDQLFRSEEHTSELQSLRHLVCRLLLEKKKIVTVVRLAHPSGHWMPFRLRLCLMSVVTIIVSAAACASSSLYASQCSPFLFFFL